jgi:glycosyltransferase involved in cell wall biosynthesis
MSILNKKRQVHVLQVMGGFPVDFNGGITNYVRILNDDLNDLSVNSYVLDNVNTSKFKMFGINFKLININSKHYRALNTGMFPLRYYSDDNAITSFGFEKQFKELLKSKNINIIHIHCIMNFPLNLIYIAKNLGVKVIISLHDYYFLCPRYTLINYSGAICKNTNECYKCINDKYKWMLCKVKIPNKFYNNYFFKNEISDRKNKFLNALNSSDLLIAVSRQVKEVFVNNGVVKDIIVNHIGNITARPNYFKKKYLSVPQKIRFGFIGAFSSHKGADLIIESVNKLNNFENGNKFEFVIWGRLDDKYVDLLKAHPKINYLGKYKQEQLQSIMQDIDICIVPPVWYDNAPQVVMESINLGVPVIGANIGGIPDFIKNKINGLLFEPGNSDALIQCMQQIITTPQLILDMNKNIIKFKTPIQHAEEIRALYCQVIKDPKEIF